jgi:Tfp pilus assembly protein PilX
MKRSKRQWRGRADDQGAALLMVLIIVTVVGLAGAALLSLSDTSIRTTIALRDEGAEAYAADGAAQVAVNSLSTGKGFATGSLFTNASNTTCFGPNTTSGTLNVPDFYPGANGRNGTAPTSVSVTCAADPATGVNATVVPITSANRPGQAIMTLGQVAGEDGINVKPLSGTPFAVDTVKSNSTIKVVSGSMQSTGAVTAKTLCTGSITPSPSCSTGTNLVDPGYAAEATTVPAYQPVPTDVLANCPDRVVTFLPGYYDDAKSLTTLMDSTGACAGSTWWFKPGVYYFDFHNNTLDTDVYRGALTASGSAADQWAIASGNLVAGTPTDSNGNVIASPGATPVMPGTCQNPTRSTSNAGVQFIFGGDSQLALGGAADAEICGTYSATKPPIGVYGVKTGTAVPTTLTGTGTTATSSLKMSTVVSPGLFTNPTNVIQQDSVYSTWAKTTATRETSTIAVTGYAPPSAIPAGSIVKTATVRVRHANSAKYVTGTGKDLLGLTFTPKGVTGSPAGPAIALTPTLPNSASQVIDSLVVQAAGGTSTFGRYVHDNGFTGADMAYAATLSHAGTESLDAIQIDISYVKPAFRNQGIGTTTTNCLKVAYTGAAGTGCAVLSTSDLTAFTGDFYVQGTTYTPIAPVDLTMSKAAQPIMRFGVISRSLWLTQTGAFSYPGPVIDIPDDTTGGIGTPIVYLTVYVCPSTTTSSCRTDPGAVTALRAKARINATAPTMTILSWSNLR